MQNKKLPKFLKKTYGYRMVILAGVLYAVAIKYFIFPSKVIMTGTEGLSIATSYFFDNPKIFIWLYAFFQASMLIFAFRKIGFRFAFRSSLLIGSVVVLLKKLMRIRFTISMMLKEFRRNISFRQ